MSAYARPRGLVYRRARPSKARWSGVLLVSALVAAALFGEAGWAIPVAVGAFALVGISVHALRRQARRRRARGW